MNRTTALLASCSVVAACASSGPQRSRVEPQRAAFAQDGGTTIAQDARDGGEGGAVVDTLHGVQVRDPFRWLEGHDDRVTAWVDAQDRQARAILNRLDAREGILAALQTTGAPSPVGARVSLRGNRFFYERFDPAAHRIDVVAYDRTSRKEIRLFNIAEMGGPIVSWWDASPDGNYIVLRMSMNGNDLVQARIFDTVQKNWLPEHIADVRYAYPTWNASGSGFYYTWSPNDPNLAAAERVAQTGVRYHKLRTSPDADAFVRAPVGQPGVLELVDASPDGHWLAAVRWYDSERTSIYLHDTREPGADWVEISPNSTSQYRVSFGAKSLYVLTNEGAPNQRVLRVDPLHPDRTQWKEVVAERKDATITDINLVGTSLVVSYLKDAEPLHVAYSDSGSLLSTIDASAIGTLASISGSPRSSEAVALFNTYTSGPFAMVVEAPKFNLRPLPFASGTAAPAAKYVTEKVFYKSPGGTFAPIFIVRSKDTAPRANGPLILSGYGAQGVNITPQYIRGLEVWLDRGGVYAEAVIRGGGEYGRAWHEAGMRQNRGNTYADFFAATEFLFKEGWTTPAKLVLRGASDAGLLVTAAAVQHPEFYAGVVAEVPLTDMLRFAASGSIGPFLANEFGSPENSNEFPILLRYSPYHNVRIGVHYPAFLILSNAADDRIDPMHARKLAAALEAADPANLVMLRTEKLAAHGGPTTEKMWLDAEADVYSFALSVTHPKSSASALGVR